MSAPLDITRRSKVDTLDRLYWLMFTLVWIEGLRFAYAIGYDWACYWGYLA